MTIARTSALTGCCLALASCGSPHTGHPQATAAVTTQRQALRMHVLMPFSAPGFTLRDQSGRNVSLRAARNDVVLVTFLYTRCPDVCPLLASRLNTALRRLPPGARAHTRVLAVSVDPEHDTPRAVRRFVSEHRLVPEFRYLTGSRRQLQPVWQAYNVLATPRNDQAIDHSAYIAVIDPRGRYRGTFDPTTPPADIAADVQRLLGSS